jgi:hypothetical protein
MKLKTLVVAVSLSALSSTALAETTPQGWQLQVANGGQYTIDIDQAQAFDGQASARLSAETSGQYQYGALGQAFSADSLKGKRVRLSAQIKTEDAEHGFLWMRADRADGRTVAFDNMQRRPARGTLDWRERSIVVDIPEDAHVIAFGFGLSGKGKVFVDEVSIKPVSLDVPVTGHSRLGSQRQAVSTATINPAPVNLGFEHGD